MNTMKRRNRLYLKRKLPRAQILNTLMEWPKFESQRAQIRTPMLKTFDAMMARVDHEMTTGSNSQRGAHKITGLREIIQGIPRRIAAERFRTRKETSR